MPWNLCEYHQEGAFTIRFDPRIAGALRVSGGDGVTDTIIVANGGNTIIIQQGVHGRICLQHDPVRKIVLQLLYGFFRTQEVKIHSLFFVLPQTIFFSMANMFPEGVGWCVDDYTGNIMIVDRKRGWSERFGRYRCVSLIRFLCVFFASSFCRIYLDGTRNGKQSTMPAYRDLLEQCPSLRDRCIVRIAVVTALRDR